MSLLLLLVGAGASTPPPVPPGPIVTTHYIRRLRRAPHLSSEQVRQFFAFLQLDVQAGTGLNTGQGVNPTIALRWSDDGGHTWSHTHTVEAGRQGQYARRAIWRRLGHGRDRVFEVSVSDPVAWRVLDAYLEATAGVD